MFAADSGIRPDRACEIVRPGQGAGTPNEHRAAFSPVIGFAYWANSQGYRQVVSAEVHHLRIGASVTGRPYLGISRATEIVGKW